MLRPFTRVAVRAPMVSLARNISVSLVLQAGQKEGKKKLKLGYKKTTEPKAKKGGLTDLKFRDAVYSLGYEKYAVPVNTQSLNEINSNLVESEPQFVTYGAKTLEKLKSFKFFKKFQYQEMFLEPVTLINQNTKKINDSFVAKVSTPGSYPRVLLNGFKGTGKLTLITQAQALVSQLENPVIQLHIDSAQSLRNGTNDYIFNHKLNKYQQPTYTARWIESIRSVNKDILKLLKLLKDVSFVNEKRQKETFKKDVSTLFDFLSSPDFGKQELLIAFGTFIEELQHHSKVNGVSVVISIDDILDIVNNWQTEYRHPDFKRIRTDEFELSNFFIQLLTGELKFDQGGFLAATRGDQLNLKTLDVGIGAVEYDPYWRSEKCEYELANRIYATRESLTIIEAENLLKLETRSLLEFLRNVNGFYPRDYTRKQNKITIAQILEPDVKKDEPDSEDVFNKRAESYYALTGGNVGEVVKAANFLYH